MAVKKYKRKSNVQLSKNFNLREFDCHCNNLCTETYVDEELVLRLQKLRTLLGKPINIESGYRCKKWNKAIGGVTNSNHMDGKATDIWVTDMTPQELAKYAEVVGFREILCYSPEGQFCHVGTRPDKWYAKTFDHGKSFTTVSTFGGSIKKGLLDKVLVKKLQTLLNTKGKYGLLVDGDFGGKTDSAVRTYQKSKGLLVDGVVGPVTWESLGI